MDPVLRAGTQSPAIAELQKLLNRNMSPPPGLKPDGQFDVTTAMAVMNYQKSKWLVADGVVDKCTWNALRGNESFIYYAPPLRLVPQPTSTTCWAASTAMLTGLTVDEVVGIAQRAGVIFSNSNGLANDSGRNDWPNCTLFAQTFALTMMPPMSWQASSLAELVNDRGPLMMDTLWRPDDYIAKTGSPGHVRVIAGMRGDGTEDGTTILLYDPWEPNRGKIESKVYGPFIRRDPCSTYHLYYR